MAQFYDPQMHMFVGYMPMEDSTDLSRRYLFYNYEKNVLTLFGVRYNLKTINGALCIVDSSTGGPRTPLPLPSIFVAKVLLAPMSVNNSALNENSYRSP
jgi:hypothetical protein